MDTPRIHGDIIVENIPPQAQIQLPLFLTQSDFYDQLMRKEKSKRRYRAYLDGEITVKFCRLWEKQAKILARAYGMDFPRFVRMAVLNKMEQFRSILGLNFDQELALSRCEVERLRLHSRFVRHVAEPGSFKN